MSNSAHLCVNIGVIKNELCLTGEHTECVHEGLLFTLRSRDTGNLWREERETAIKQTQWLCTVSIKTFLTIKKGLLCATYISPLSLVATNLIKYDSV